MANNDTKQLGATRDAFWATHYARFVRETGDTVLADDLTQDLALVALDYERRTGPARNFSALANTLHQRIFVNWLRAKPRQHRFESLDDTTHGNFADPARRPDDAVDLERQLAALRATVADITESPQLRELVTHWDESTAELAARLGTTLTAVATYRYKLVQRLRRDPRLRW